MRLTAEQLKGAVCAEKPSREQFEIAYAEDSVEHRSGCGHPTMQRPLYPLSGRHPSAPGRGGARGTDRRTVSERVNEITRGGKDAGSMTDGHGVSRGISTLQAVRVAWDRACAFSLVGRGFPLLARFIAPWLWPFHLASVGGQGDRIRLLGGTSLAVDDGGTHRVHRPTLVAAALSLVAEFSLLLLLGAALAIALLPVLGPNLSALVGVLMVMSPLVAEGMVGGVIRMSRDAESLTLNRRRRELAKDGPASVMSSLVRSRHTPPGTGRLLLAAMKSEWQEQQSVVIFYPATEPLVAYYTLEGAVLDDGADRRMKFDFRCSVSPRIPGDADAAKK